MAHVEPADAYEEMREKRERCGIKHGFGDQTCILVKGDGFCRCRATRGTGGTLTYSEWESRDGEFYRHVGYQTIYPSNNQDRETRE